MPHTRKLQGWITIRGPDSGTLIQDADQWLDLWDYDDIVVWCQVTDASNVDNLIIQTSPVCEAATFIDMGALSIAVTAGPRTTAFTFSSTLIPLARYVRWKCVGRVGSSFSLTFRAWIAASGRLFAPPDGIEEAGALPPIGDGDGTELAAETDAGSPPMEAPTEESHDQNADGPFEEADEQAWTAWRPPVVFAGPSTRHIPGMEPPTADLTGALQSRRYRRR